VICQAASQGLRTSHAVSSPTPHNIRTPRREFDCGCGHQRIPQTRSDPEQQATRSWRPPKRLNALLWKSLYLLFRRAGNLPDVLLSAFCETDSRHPRGIDPGGRSERVCQNQGYPKHARASARAHVSITKYHVCKRLRRILNREIFGPHGKRGEQENASKDSGGRYRRGILHCRGKFSPSTEEEGTGGVRWHERSRRV